MRTGTLEAHFQATLSAQIVSIIGSHSLVVRILVEEEHLK